LNSFAIVIVGLFGAGVTTVLVNWAPQPQRRATANRGSLTPQQVQGLSGTMTVLGAGGYFGVAASAGSASREASTTYGYDKLYRLTRVAAPSSTTAYSYDRNGNRLSKVLSTQTTGYTYDHADRIPTAGTTNYTVNNAGNETARGSDAFGCD
jgi:YD repeat-containing protein